MQTHIFASDLTTEITPLAQAGETKEDALIKAKKTKTDIHSPYCIACGKSIDFKKRTTLYEEGYTCHKCSPEPGQSVG